MVGRLTKTELGMTRFDFIGGEEFRNSLEADYKELKSCMETKAWKAVHVLAGSVIEAMLVDYLVLIDYKSGANQDPLRMDLFQVISACRTEGILSEKAAQLCNVVRSYRNLIHPGRLVRLSEAADENGAKIAEALVEVIADQVSLAKKMVYGFTAEQIVSKIERDPSSIPILSSLLTSTNPTELERLITTVIPERYLQLDEWNHDLKDNLKTCFRLARDLAGAKSMKKATERFVKVLKEDSEFKVLTYETAFFQAFDLLHLSASDAVIVKQHLLGQMAKDITEELLTALEGLGMCLANEDVTEYVDPLVRASVAGQPPGLHEAAKKHLVGQYSIMNETVRERVLGRLDDWIAHYEQLNKEALAEEARALKNDIVISTIPF
jgi:hypothetical protein